MHILQSVRVMFFLTSKLDYTWWETKHVRLCVTTTQLRTVLHHSVLWGKTDYVREIIRTQWLALDNHFFPLGSMSSDHGKTWIYFSVRGEVKKLHSVTGLCDRPLWQVTGFWTGDRPLWQVTWLCDMWQMTGLCDRWQGSVTGDRPLWQVTGLCDRWHLSFPLKALPQAYEETSLSWQRDNS